MVMPPKKLLRSEPEKVDHEVENKDVNDPYDYKGTVIDYDQV